MPNFVLKLLRHNTMTLSRQIKEAVRIRNRGGAGKILNSCSEFTRRHIPCLIIEEDDKVGSGKREEQKTQGGQEWIMRSLDERETIWVAKNSQESIISETKGKTGYGGEIETEDYRP